MISREETLKEIDKAKKWKIFFLVFSIGLFCVGCVLFVLFFTESEIPTLFLGIVAWVWSALLLNQLFKTRDLIGLMTTHLGGSEAEEGGEGSGKAENTVPEESESDES